MKALYNFQHQVLRHSTQRLHGEVEDSVAFNPQRSEAETAGKQKLNVMDQLGLLRV